MGSGRNISRPASLPRGSEAGHDTDCRLRREPAAGTYGVITTGVLSVPPALEVTVMDGGKVDVSVTGPSV